MQNNCNMESLKCDYSNDCPHDNEEFKIRVVKRKHLCGALEWLGYYPYKQDENGYFLFKRSYGFDRAFEALHSTRSMYHKNRWE